MPEKKIVLGEQDRMSTEQTLPADIQNQLAAMQQTTLHPHDWRVLERLIAQRLGQVTRHLTEERKHRLSLQQTLDDWQKQIRRLQSEGEAAEATIATLREQIEEFTGWWHLNRDGSVNRAYDYIDKAVKRLDAALAAPAAGTPEVAVLGSQGEPGTNGLTPLPGAATLCACAGTRSVEDVPVIGGGEETRCLDCGRAVWAAGTPAKEDA